ncbi:hypothetical protein [Rhizobium anhuiense]|uniref:hypothetical protein n=1 Tax=Rhizobium anhuiense TaxID=1184720 RepID=UPI001FDEBE32|nr:hypothetical protein [Rhizobium anhuiense]
MTNSSRASARLISPTFAERSSEFRKLAAAGSPVNSSNLLAILVISMWVITALPTNLSCSICSPGSLGSSGHVQAAENTNPVSHLHAANHDRDLSVPDEYADHLAEGDDRAHASRLLTDFQKANPAGAGNSATARIY